MDRMPNEQEKFYSFDPSEESYIYCDTFHGKCTGDKLVVRLGWFADEQYASEYFKALLGIE